MTIAAFVLAGVFALVAVYAMLVARRARRAVAAEEARLARVAEQLRQAQQLAIVGRLAGGVAHDFNNLLTVARTYCDLLIEETAATDPRHADLMEIRRATDRAAMLARRLLSVGRKHDFDPRRLDLNETVRSLQAMFGRTLPESVSLAAQLEEGLLPVRGDASLLELVVMNLVLNAVDAMPSGGTLTISTRTITAAGNGGPESVELAVSDTGMGMDAATREHMFEPFFTTKEPGKGTGLGLATVYGIIEQHGGRIRIESEIGHGTTFTLLFPIIAEGESSPGDPMRFGDSRSAQPSPLESVPAIPRLPLPSLPPAPGAATPRAPSVPRA